jgi:uncharacterized protein YbaP (TraB family)
VVLYDRAVGIRPRKGVIAMSKKRHRYKVSLAVERIREITDFLESHKSHRNLSSQERRQFERVLKELTKELQNSNESRVWVNTEIIGEVLNVFLRIYESTDVMDNKIE